MKHLTFLIKPVSSKCNMRCTYCFYEDVSVHRQTCNYDNMSKETMEHLVKKSMAQTQPCTISFCFQGGEPLLIGLDFYESFVSCVKEYQNEFCCVHYAIQTNGYLLSKKWCTFLKKHKFLVGVSLDGYEENHDQYRKDLHGMSTFKRILNNISLLKEENISFNILTVLTSTLAKHPDELFDFYLREQLTNIQLIPCLPGLDTMCEGYLRPDEYANFYKKFYKRWLDIFNKKLYMSVTLFENIIPMYEGIAPEQCGLLGTCMPQFVVESNGNVYPCDFYVLDMYCVGNINTHTIPQLAMETLKNPFIKEKKKEIALCNSCRYVSMCHGNCKRMRSVLYDETYCGYQDFLSYSEYSMRQVAKQLFNSERIDVV